MKNRIDLSGQRFGKLTVIEFSHTAKRRRQYWLCKCECGNEKIMESDSIKKAKSCGCFIKEFAKTINFKHGRYKTPEHNTWQLIIERCTNPNNSGFYKYGMRGIMMCDRWLHSFENFYADMGDRPSTQHSIDRIDNNGNYEPSNCRWATRKEQGRNKRNNIWIEYNGRKMILAEWERELGTGRNIDSRMRKGSSGVDAVEYYINKNAMKCK